MKTDRAVDGLPMIERRKVGRPALSSGAVPPADVHLTLPPEDYDATETIQKKYRLASIQSVIRIAVKRLIDEERSGALVIKNRV